MRFILVDEILEMTPGLSIKAAKFVSPEEDYFRDHFPGFPVVPGVLLVEMMAQAAGMSLDAEATVRGKSMLARITSASFRDWVRPGQTAVIHGKIQSSRPQFATAKCRIEIEERDVASAEMLFSFVPLAQFAAGYRNAVLERYLQSHSPADTGAPHGKVV